MSDAADYAGRSIDVLTFPRDAATRVTPRMAAPGSGGLVCAGVVRLAQRWLLEFLTIRGSVPQAPTRGSDFLGQLRAGVIRTAVDAEQAFYLSSAQIEEAMRLQDGADDPDDECFGSVELTALDLVGDRLALTVLLTSRAGSPVNLILPIPLVPSANTI